MFKKFIPSVIASALLGLSGCVVVHQAGGDNDVVIGSKSQRLGLAGVYLGDAHSTASALIKNQYGSTPVCENRRVPIGNTRKAFSLEICNYKPKGVSLNNAPVKSVVTYFLDEKLVRVDVDVKGDADSFKEALSNTENMLRSSNQRNQRTTDRVETVWSLGDDQMSLSHLALASVVEYRLRDMRLAEKMPWLFE